MDYTQYTNETFPPPSDWGMTEPEYCDQALTVHGKAVLPLMGSYYKDYFSSVGLDLACDSIQVYADNSTRDVQSARMILDGMNCSAVPIVTAGENYLSMEVYPVVNDHYNNLGCATATQEQVTGLYGGDVSAVTDAFSTGIELISRVLNEPACNASVCEEVNPDFDPATMQCTLSETGYEWNGQYYEGDFASPLSYAGYFAETFMFQYVSNLTTWAFGKLDENQLSDLYNLHEANMEYGANIWNSKAYGSQQLGYIMTSLKQYIDQKAISGVAQLPTKQLLLLVSHDFNIYYLRTLLDLNWITSDTPANVATTGGSLTFELYKSDTGDDYYVQVKYTTASPQQQRFATPLTLQDPPGEAYVVIPACGLLLCPFDTFVDIVLDAIDNQCVEQPLQNTLRSMLPTSSSSDDDTYITKQWYGVSFIILSVLVGVYCIGYNFIYKKYFQAPESDRKAGSLISVL